MEVERPRRNTKNWRGLRGASRGRGGPRGRGGLSRLPPVARLLGRVSRARARGSDLSDGVGSGRRLTGAAGGEEAAMAAKLAARALVYALCTLCIRCTLCALCTRCTLCARCAPCILCAPCTLCTIGAPCTLGAPCTTGRRELGASQGGEGQAACGNGGGGGG